MDGSLLDGAALMAQSFRRPRLIRGRRAGDLTLVEAKGHLYADIGKASFFANFPESYGPIIA